MDRLTRDLMVKCYGGVDGNLSYLYFLYKHTARKELLKTLVRKGLTGWSLNTFIRLECGGEPIRLMGYLLKEIQRVNTVKAPRAASDGTLY